MNRVKRALEGFPETKAVEFYTEREEFSVTYRSPRSLGEDYQRAVGSTVVAPAVRQALGKIGQQGMEAN
ncbi:MAG: hypothetical protein M1598_00715 [Actinobacteria bacterium]|nr:hypothetical protein [Actinomycetota bacterium]